MKKHILLLAISFITFSSFSQNYIIDWQQCFGGSGYESAHGIIATEFGSLLCGDVNSDDGNFYNYHGHGDAWVVAFDTLGTIIWDRCYGGSSLDGGYFIVEAKGENAYYLIGTTASTDGDITYNPNPEFGSIWVIKIDIEGDIIWDITIGNGHDILNYNIAASSTNDGGLVIGANIAASGGDVSHHFGDFDAWIGKISVNGEIQWDQTIGTETGAEFLNIIKQLSDGSYLAAIYGIPKEIGSGNINCSTYSSTYTDVILFKMDSIGNKEWDRCYGGSQSESLIDFIEYKDGLLLASSTNSRDGDVEGTIYHEGNDIWIIHTDISGNIIWSKCFGGSDYETPRQLFVDADNNIFLFGHTSSNNFDVSGNHASQDIWFVKIGEDTEILYQKCFGGFGDESLYKTVCYKDDIFSIAATIYNSNNNSGDIQCELQGSLNTNMWIFAISDSLTSNLIEEEQFNFEIYPNPANKTITVSLPNEDMHLHSSSEIMLQLINSQGILMDVFPLSSKTTINTTNYPSGLYFIQCYINNQFLSSKVVILHE